MFCIEKNFFFSEDAQIIEFTINNFIQLKTIHFNVWNNRAFGVESVIMSLIGEVLLEVI